MAPAGHELTPLPRTRPERIAFRQTVGMSDDIERLVATVVTTGDFDRSAELYRTVFGLDLQIHNHGIDVQ